MLIKVIKVLSVIAKNAQHYGYKWLLFTLDAEEEVIEEEEFIEEDGYLEEEQIVTDDGDDSESKSSRKGRTGKQNGQTRVKRRRVFRIARTTERQRGKTV